MNPKLFLALFSYRNELKFVALAFAIALLIPIIAVILLTHIGLDIISDKLAQVDENTGNVQLLNPATGEVAEEVDLTVAWPAKGVYTLEFGESSGFQIFHTGLDVANAQGKIGDPINAMLPGKIIYAGEIYWGYGKHIIIDHGKNITTLYAHLDKIFVVKGQEIPDTKQVIGRMGSTGWSTGPHLHFEIRVYGIPVNPRTFLGGLN